LLDPVWDPVQPRRNADGDVVTGRYPTGVAGVVTRADGDAGHLVRPGSVTRQQIGEGVLDAGPVERVEHPDAVGGADGVAGAAAVLGRVGDPGDPARESVDHADGLGLGAVVDGHG
jgi:hypothetical protein